MKTKGKLTITLRTATMKLLQKGDKDPTNPNNFCPISLLSVIYKLASCAISNRLKTSTEVPVSGDGITVIQEVRESESQ